MIGSIIGGGLQLAGSIAGSIASARAAKKANKMVEAQKAKNQAWYDRNYNQPATQRADAVDLMNRSREYMDNRNQRSAMTNAVMGGTDEALAMDKANTNQVLAETAANINAQADQRKDAIEQNYMDQDTALTNQQFNTQMQKAQNISQAASGASAGAAGIVGSIFDKK